MDFNEIAVLVLKLGTRVGGAPSLSCAGWGLGMSGDEGEQEHLTSLKWVGGMHHSPPTQASADQTLSSYFRFPKGGEGSPEYL